jgi:beta-1,4-mannosyl-glycoprotein beta-1,4-N-acetylglucosaminyltransferase
MIWDGFMFFNEFDLLEVRLHELDPYVDRFILVEADFTFQGGTKPYYFEENKDRYKPFLDRIMHVKLTGPVDTDDPWVREKLQRNAIANGLTDAAEDDIVLVGDCDEIPRGDKIAEAVAIIEAAPSAQVAFESDKSFYHVNNRCWTVKWPQPQAVTAKACREHGAEAVRMGCETALKIKGGGVHYCNQGDPAWLIEKLESFSHSEVNLPQYKDPEFLQSCIDQGREMTGRTDIQFRVEDPDTFWMPQYLRDNREGKFAHMFA